MDRIEQRSQNNQSISDREFCDIIRRSGKFDKEKIANFLNVSPFTPWSWLSDRTNFPAYAIPAYVKATGDTSPLDWINEQCGYIARPIMKKKVVGHASIQSVELSLCTNCGRVIEEIETALKDNRVDIQEYQKINRQITEARRILLALKEMLLKRITP